MSKIVHEKLRKLIADHGERKPPIAFGGRENIIGSVCEISQYLFDAERFLGGDTFIIGGPPGSGKTSLVHEIIKRLAKRTLMSKPVQSVFCASPSAVGAYQNLLWNLASALTGTSKEKLRSEHKSLFSVEVKAEALGAVKGEYGREVKVPNANSLDRLISLTKKPANQPIVVFIDEAQNVEKGGDVARLIDMLHTQNELPILLVCAGLANTKDKLHELKLVSRSTLKHYFALGPLEPEESAETARHALDVICEKAGVQRTSDQKRDLIADRIATESDNWPRHLTCYLIALCEELAKQDRPSLADFRLVDAIRTGSEYRQAYYQERLNTSKMPIPVLADLYRAIRAEHLSQLACEDTLEEIIARYQDKGATSLKRRFPTGEEAFEWVRRLGLVTTDGPDETCRVPIPSMETFVEEKCRALN